MAISKKPHKLFVIRKYIKAVSASEAIKKDRSTPVDDVWVDDEWKKNSATRLESAIGFRAENPNDFL